MHRLIKVKTVAINAVRACWLPAVVVSLACGQLLAQQQPQTNTEDQQAQPQQTARQQNQPQSDQQANQQQRQQGRRSAQQQGQQGQTQGPILGLRLEPSPTTGTRVTAVMPEGPAERAGVRVGDYILSVDDQKVNSAEELTEKIRDKQFGDQVSLSIWRNGQPMTVNATLQQVSMPQQPQQQQGFQQQGYQAGFAASGQQGDQAGADDQSPWIGVTLSEPQSGQKGVAVRAVYPSGPAAFAGLDPGDVITQINGQNVTAPDQAAQLIRGLPLNKPTEFMIVRNGEQQTVTVEPAPRSQFLAEFGGQTQQGYGGSEQFNQFSGVPAHAMMLEQHRRFAEQHQRIEQKIMELQEEVRQLRMELQQSRRGGNQ